jgi:hypothetical protein
MFANSNSEGILSDTMSEIGELGKQLKNDTITTFDKLTESMDIFQDKLDDTPVQGGGGGGTTLTIGQKCINAGGIMVGGKCMNGTNDITATLAKGGIVMKPTKALIGEGSEPEAVLPLSRLDKMIGNTTSELKVSGAATINVNITSNTPISSNMEPALITAISNRVGQIANQDGQLDANLPPPSNGYIETMA